MAIDPPNMVTDRIVPASPPPPLPAPAQPLPFDAGKLFNNIATGLLVPGVLWLITSVYNSQLQVQQLKDRGELLQKQIDEMAAKQTRSIAQLTTHGSQLTRIEDQASKVAKDSSVVLQKIEEATKGPQESSPRAFPTAPTKLPPVDKIKKDG